MRTTRDRLFWTGVALAVFCAVVALGLPAPQRYASLGPALQPSPAPDNPPLLLPPENDSLFAYSDATGIHLLRGAIEIGGAQHALEAAEDGSFTEDGRFWFAVGQDEIRAIDLRDFHERVYPTPQRGHSAVHTVGGSAVVWLGSTDEDDDNGIVRLIRLDFGDPEAKPEQLPPIRLPDPTAEERAARTRTGMGRNATYLAGAGHGMAAIARLNGYPGVHSIADHLYLARLDGTTADLGHFGGTCCQTGGSFSPDGRRFLFHLGWGNGAWPATSAEMLFDLDSPQPHGTLLVSPTGYDDDFFGNLWWSRDGDVRIGWDGMGHWRPGSAPDEAGPPYRSLLRQSSPSIWELAKDGRWTLVDPTGYTRDLPLPDGDDVVVIAEVAADWRRHLFLRHHHTLIHIADDVEWAMAPRWPDG